MTKPGVSVHCYLLIQLLPRRYFLESRAPPLTNVGLAQARALGFGVRHVHCRPAHALLLASYW